MGTRHFCAYRCCACLLAVVFAGSGCCVRPANGDSQSDFTAPRRIDPADVPVTAGHRVQAVVAGRTFPGTLDDAKRVEILEVHLHGSRPRLIRMPGRTGLDALPSHSPASAFAGNDQTAR